MGVYANDIGEKIHENASLCALPVLAWTALALAGHFSLLRCDWTAGGAMAIVPRASGELGKCAPAPAMTIGTCSAC